MKNQFLSVEQMREVIDMGIDVSKASMCWFIGATPDLLPIYSPIEYIENEYIPTFTLQDILEMLPKPCYLKCIDNDLYQCKITTKNGWTITTGTSSLNAAFNMLNRCKQNNEL